MGQAESASGGIAKCLKSLRPGDEWGGGSVGWGGAGGPSELWAANLVEFRLCFTTIYNKVGKLLRKNTQH